MPTQSADEKVIRLARRVQTQAIANGDIEAVAKFWSPDITICRALGHRVSGIEEARAVIQGPSPGDATRTIIYQRESLSVQVSDNWPLAYEEGQWSGYLGSVDTVPIQSGRYSAHWVKRDGRWFIRSELFVALTCSGPGCDAIALP
jgi:ketosteroid isomerase-like protein